jgi:hypothetical protein
MSQPTTNINPPSRQQNRSFQHAAIGRDRFLTSKTARFNMQQLVAKLRIFSTHLASKSGCALVPLFEISL